MGRYCVKVYSDRATAYIQNGAVVRTRNRTSLTCSKCVAASVARIINTNLPPQVTAESVL